MRIIWFIAGSLSLVIGIIGAFLPLIPTVPLLLLAAFFFGKSSERAHQWLVNHPRLGPPIRDWQNNGVIRRRAKVFASISIASVFALSVFLGLPWHVLAIQGVTLSAVSLFIWTRPEEDSLR